MGFQWIIPFLPSPSTFLPAEQHTPGRAAPVCAQGDGTQSSGGSPVFPARREQEQGWQERGGGRARSCGTERAAQSALRTAGACAATAANGDGKGWRGKDATQLVRYGFDL